MGKGADFERGICRYLSLWWTDQKDPDVFWRNPVRITKRSLGKYQLGDIKADKAIGEHFTEVFNVEFKRGYSKGRSGKKVKNVPWDLLDLIDYSDRSPDLEKKQITIFWNQTLRDAEISKRIPLLIFRRDYHKEVICIKDEDLSHLEDYNSTYRGSHIIYRDDLGNLSFFKNKKGFYLIFIRMEYFFNWLKPETVKLIYDEKK